MHRVLIAVFLSCVGVVAVALPRASSSENRSPPPPQPRDQRTSSSEVAAAQQLLLDLLGPTGIVNTSLLASLMPTGTDPCQPVFANLLPLSGASSAAVLPAGTCGPQAQLGWGSQSLEYFADCGWSWLSCNNGRIVAVDLSCKSGGSGGSGCIAPLRGTLPPAGPGLPWLASLDLSGNVGLTGGLSLVDWSVQPELLYLYLRGCGLGGTIPDNWTAVPMLQELDLANNAFSGPLPSGLSYLKGLLVLKLGGNTALSGWLPSSWAELDMLRMLDVQGACRLCGYTDMFQGLKVAYLGGTHVNSRCRPEDCDTSWRGLHHVFQGVMAAFASVLGLTALVLVLRRIRDCTNAHNVAAARLAAVEAVATDPRVGASRGSRRQRNHRRRQHGGGPLHVVPLYTVEFCADGDVKWDVSYLGPRNRSSRCRRSHATQHQEQQSQDQQQQEQPGPTEPDSLTHVVEPREGREGEGPPPEAAGALERQAVATGAISVGVGRRTVPADAMAVEMAVVGAAVAASVTERAGARLPVEGGGSRGHGLGPGRAESIMVAAADGGSPTATELPGSSRPGALLAAPAAHNDPDGDSMATTPAALDEGQGDTVGRSAAAGRPARRVGSGSSTRRLPQPPDAVILMPDELEVCLGRRLSCNDGEAIRGDGDTAAATAVPGCCMRATLPPPAVEGTLQPLVPEATLGPMAMELASYEGGCRAGVGRAFRGGGADGSSGAGETRQWGGNQSADSGVDGSSGDPTGESSR